MCVVVVGGWVGGGGGAERAEGRVQCVDPGDPVTRRALQKGCARVWRSPGRQCARPTGHCHRCHCRERWRPMGMPQRAPGVAGSRSTGRLGCTSSTSLPLSLPLPFPLPLSLPPPRELAAPGRVQAAGGRTRVRGTPDRHLMCASLVPLRTSCAAASTGTPRTRNSNCRAGHPGAPVGGAHVVHHVGPPPPVRQRAQLISMKRQA